MTTALSKIWRDDATSTTDAFAYGFDDLGELFC